MRVGEVDSEDVEHPAGAGQGPPPGRIGFDAVPDGRRERQARGGALQIEDVLQRG